ncbi:MAG: DUF1365 domain-containing protein [Betaproteobacteria bacterium]|nr:DUF1365 domain-containing protein [Betaproteobacteria bacterium]
MPRIHVGKVMHQRLKPVGHRFVYGVFFLSVPLSRLDALEQCGIAHDRFGLVSFRTRDHGAKDGGPLLPWIRALLAREGVAADGEIILQCFPRVLGYVFNPISIWYCHDRAGRLIAALAEVRNTFGEHHNYLVMHADQHPIEAGDWLTARKVFHVSPFCEVKGHYRFRFDLAGARLFAQIDYHDGDLDTDKLLITTVHGDGVPARPRVVMKALLTHPLLTFGVVFRIHWQALKLWLKRVPFFSKPEPPPTETTR